ncbi:Mce protein [Mycobacterium colombiense]|uniref:Mce protein n=1 Tax=Mycobacterium colombiense TaxID=339268 RepID=UPI0007EFD557|nr:Mce protein [Mycobacterium colombiense]OBK63215.1 Mce protein [Mycobacterium colombiense]
MAKHADASQAELSKITRSARAPASGTRADHDASTSPDDVTDNEASSETPPVANAGPEKPQVDELEDDTGAPDEDDDTDPDSAADASAGKRRSPVRIAMVLGVITVVALGTLAGWFGYRIYQSQQVQHQRDLLVQVARQGALNLTTIDYQHADADVQRVLDSATGGFYDDFSHRSKPFIEVVKKAQSTSVGTITEAGMESQSGNEAQVLVAVSVKTSNLGAADQDPRYWRMRITVQKVGNEAKVSNVVFVP